MIRPQPLSPIEAFETIQRILEATDSISWTTHARQRALERNFTADDVRRVLTTGTVSPKPEWDDRYENWKYTVSGWDCDNCPLAVVVAVEPQWARITLITGTDTR